MTSSVFSVMGTTFFNVQVVLDKLHAGLSVNIKKIKLEFKWIQASWKLRRKFQYPVPTKNSNPVITYYTLYYTDYNASFMFLTVNNHKYPIIQSTCSYHITPNQQNALLEMHSVGH